MNGLEMHLAIIHQQGRSVPTPSLVVIDPITNFVSEGTGDRSQRSMLTAPGRFPLKSRGITALFTNLASCRRRPSSTRNLGHFVAYRFRVIAARHRSSTASGIRGLYILKSRGMAHSNQIREFLAHRPGHSAHRRCTWGRKAFSPARLPAWPRKRKRRGPEVQAQFWRSKENGENCSKPAAGRWRPRIAVLSCNSRPMRKS